MSDPRILYIEDEPANRLLVRRVLEAEGYSITEAVDGPSGLEMAAKMQPDLILLDINLPEIDGYDLARRFRETPGLQNVPILAVTANVMKGDRERTLEAGCDGYIQKPIDVDRLPEQVKAVFESCEDKGGDKPQGEDDLPGSDLEDQDEGAHESGGLPAETQPEDPLWKGADPPANLPREGEHWGRVRRNDVQQDRIRREAPPRSDSYKRGMGRDEGNRDDRCEE